MNIIQKLLTINPFSRPNKKLKGVKGIIIHWVANTNSTAEANRNFFESRKNGKLNFGSAHYIVGLKGEIIQCIPDDEIAYHVGSKIYTPLASKKFLGQPNSWTLGVECCHIKNNGEMSKETYNSTTKLIVELCKKHNLTHNDIYLHYDITGKICHKWFVDNKSEWLVFKNVIEARLK